jgi:DNA helicase-2/ATP-dependent DNA helicase PcrA
MEEKLFPHSRSMEDAEQLEEERRLCYVGVTRAKEYLYLLYTFRRTLYGESELREPSRFLNDLPTGLIKGRAQKRVRQQGLGLEAGRYLGRQQAGVTSFSPGPARRRRQTPGLDRRPPARAERSPSEELRFETGDEVEHRVFGRGVVIESKVSGGDEQVTVAFAGVGLKRLMAGMAPMDKVEGES